MQRARWHERHRREHARAVRHSRRVRFLRRAIPIAAVLAVVFLFALTWFNPFARYGGISIGPISVSGTRVVMDAPRLRGFQDETRPYEVTAEDASQDVREPHLVDLRELRANITIDDAGQTARIEAASGRFDTQSEYLVLERDVRVVSSTGYVLDLSVADIDFGAGTVVSDAPVSLTFTEGTIKARSMRISDGGDVISFEGGVESVLAAPRLGGDAQNVAPAPADPSGTDSTR
ncbi:MAG: lipopolysaccharide export system permease component LptC [Saliniramus fredricksonii]|jgi:lipopolysaccharide export system protein LptC|uniref:Lipopolysaccharide export system permease component LptC n=1 Tax=Saliniramus fredricksonii TaxID=1653334 RepID=A0A0P7ZXW7_9HYPH|nr:MAG: lipopolysaccharide export system permease component LptC [Saliniramus fredricksonii]SCC80697.1 lipopolysaccharide export system protein LptC [Saliniramus fredricksonii]